MGWEKKKKQGTGVLILFFLLWAAVMFRKEVESIKHQYLIAPIGGVCDGKGNDTILDDSKTSHFNNKENLPRLLVRWTAPALCLSHNIRTQVFKLSLPDFQWITNVPWKLWVAQNTADNRKTHISQCWTRISERPVAECLAACWSQLYSLTFWYFMCFSSSLFLCALTFCSILPC